MIQSMTAFARVQKQIDAGHLCWELRSVNHRYLDLSFRLPESFRFMETSLRTLTRDKISRGKLECQLKFQSCDSENQSILINKNKIEALVKLSHQLSASHHLANDFAVSNVLSWPDVVQVSTPDVEGMVQTVESMFVEAIEQLQQVRTTEGKTLASYLQKRLQKLDKEIEHSRSIVATQAQQTKDKLLTRLHAVKMEVAEARIEQEIALMITRLDVSEELNRLQIHADEVGRIVQCTQLAGRRLDFLMQELNREANTLSAKSDSIELTQSAVEMKVLIEQMREQIQNIE